MSTPSSLVLRWALLACTLHTATFGWQFLDDCTHYTAANCPVADLRSPGDWHLTTQTPTKTDPSVDTTGAIRLTDANTSTVCHATLNKVLRSNSQLSSHKLVVSGEWYIWSDLYENNHADGLCFFMADATKWTGTSAVVSGGTGVGCDGLIGGILAVSINTWKVGTTAGWDSVDIVSNMDSSLARTPLWSREQTTLAMGGGNTNYTSVLRSRSWVPFTFTLTVPNATSNKAGANISFTREGSNSQYTTAGISLTSIPTQWNVGFGGRTGAATDKHYVRVQSLTWEDQAPTFCQLCNEACVENYSVCHACSTLTSNETCATAIGHCKWCRSNKTCIPNSQACPTDCRNLDSDSTLCSTSTMGCSFCDGLCQYNNTAGRGQIKDAAPGWQSGVVTIQLDTTNLLLSTLQCSFTWFYGKNSSSCTNGNLAPSNCTPGSNATNWDPMNCTAFFSFVPTDPQVADIGLVTFTAKSFCDTTVSLGTVQFPFDASGPSISCLPAVQWSTTQTLIDCQASAVRAPLDMYETDTLKNTVFFTSTRTPSPGGMVNDTWQETVDLYDIDEEVFVRLRVRNEAWKWSTWRGVMVNLGNKKQATGYSVFKAEQGIQFHFTVVFRAAFSLADYSSEFPSQSNLTQLRTTVMALQDLRTTISTTNNSWTLSGFFLKTDMDNAVFTNTTLFLINSALNLFPTPSPSKLMPDPFEFVQDVAFNSLLVTEPQLTINICSG